MYLHNHQIWELVIWGDQTGKQISLIQLDKWENEDKKNAFVKVVSKTSIY